MMEAHMLEGWSLTSLFHLGMMEIGLLDSLCQSLRREIASLKLLEHIVISFHYSLFKYNYKF